MNHIGHTLNATKCDRHPFPVVDIKAQSCGALADRAGWLSSRLSHDVAGSPLSSRSRRTLEMDYDVIRRLGSDRQLQAVIGVARVYVFPQRVCGADWRLL